MNKLTLGTAQLGMDYGISNKNGKPSMMESMGILDFAYNHNIKSFDTAAAYGNSEKVIGSWKNKEIGKDLSLASKIPSLAKQGIDKSKLERMIREHLESSFLNLNINKLDHLLLHDFNDVYYYGENIFKILQNLKNENIVDSFGCSLYDLNELQYVSKYNVGTIQIPGSIFNQTIIESELLSQIKKTGTTVFVRSAFVQGLIFMKDDEIPEKLKNIKIHLKILRQMAHDKNISIVEAAFNYVRNHPNTDSVVFGVDTIEQLKQIVSINKEHQFDPSDVREFFSDISTELIDPRYWG